MRHAATLTAALVLGAAVAVAGASGKQNARSVLPAKAASISSDGVLGVEKLMKAPERYRGPVRVEGVVSAVSPKQQTLALIDTQEFRQCGTVDCAELALPVRWTGSMPAVKQTVRVEGQVQEAGGKLVFVARRLERVRAQEGGWK